MPEKEAEKQATRKGSPHIKVYVLPEEKEVIEERARATRNSAGGYLRAVGLGYEVQSLIDAEQVALLAKVNADQGRLGGLLKMWLASDERFAGYDEQRMRATIQAVLERIALLQDELLQIAQRA